MEVKESDGFDNKSEQPLIYIDWVACISFALIIVFSITLLTMYFFPIYPDEIQSRFWLSRLPYDFPEKISGAPTCLSTFFQPIPETMYLPGLINWFVHGTLESVTALRQVGFVVAFLWVAGLAIYLNNRFKTSLIEGYGHKSHSKLPLYIIGFFISVFSIGVFPFFLITNRGEQLIFPSVILLITLFLISKSFTEQDNPLKIIGLVVLYFIAVSLILYGHPKGLFLIPLFVVVGWEIFSHFKSRLPIIFALILLLLQIAQSISAYKFSFQCNEMPQFEAMLKGFTFDPLSLFYDPHYFFDHAYDSFAHFTKYLHQLGFKNHTDIDYLPILPLTNSAKFVNILIKLDFVIIFFAQLLFLPSLYYRKDILVGRFITINLVLLILLGCTLSSAIFNIPKNWYDAGYMYALLLIILIFFIGENFSGIFQNSITRKFLIYLGVVALLSQIVLIQRYLPTFIAGYAGPSISIAKYDKRKFQHDLSAASLACNIDPIQSKKLVVDDYTYLYFQKSKWPMAITYIWLGNDDKSIRQFFLKVDSDGLVVSCSPMLEPFKLFVKREGSVCCITKEALKSLSTLP